jgi:predicted RNA-binding Zn ribbon-like protein
VRGQVADGDGFQGDVVVLQCELERRLEVRDRGAAELALVAAGDPAVTLGRCAAAGCGNYFVDQSRNRTRRFCGNACASRTTVAAYRARTAQE